VLLGAGLVLSVGTVCQDFVEVPWSTSDDGRLLWQYRDPELADHEGEWLPLFDGLLDGKAQTITAGEHLRYGPLLLLPLLLHGDGGAAAIDEAGRRLRKLGLRVSFEPAQAALRDSDPLRDLLRVRYLGSLDVAAADYTLSRWAADPERDHSVRAAAAGELGTRPNSVFWSDADDVRAARVTRNGVAALHAGLQHLPDDFDLLLGVHSAALPTAGNLLRAWRRYQLRFASMVVMDGGASISPASYLTGQCMLDYPGQLAYELAVRFGNWRVDHALFALYLGDPDRWWFHLGGKFDVDRIEAGLRASDFDVLRTALLCHEQSPLTAFLSLDAHQNHAAAELGLPLAVNAGRR
jgi:hypothetical protein